MTSMVAEQAGQRGRLVASGRSVLVAVPSNWRQRCERSFPSSVGEEAEVADADQALGQNVKKKSAQELICRNGHDLLLAAVGIVSPAE